MPGWFGSLVVFGILDVKTNEISRKPRCAPILLCLLLKTRYN